MPVDISDEAGEGAIDSHSRFADTLDELDGVLLTAIEEVSRADGADMTGSRAEAHLVELWRTTFTAAAAAQEAWLEQAFVKRGRAIVETVYPDVEERRRFDDIESEDFIDPQLFLRWQGTLPRRAQDDAVAQPEPAALTGTDGRRQRYNVIPIAEGAVVRWLDPAGFELARSEDILGEFDGRLITNDYELRAGQRGSAVHRTFSAGSRA